MLKFLQNYFRKCIKPANDTPIVMALNSSSPASAQVAVAIALQSVNT